MLDLNITLLFQLANFFIALFVLNLLLIRPVREIIKKRNGIMDGMAAEADAFNAEATEKLNAYEAELARAGRKADGPADLSAVLERYLGNDGPAARQGDGQRQNQRRGRNQGKAPQNQPKQHAAPQNQKQAQPKAAPQPGEGKAAANHKRRYRPHHRRGKSGGGQPPQA